MFMDRGGWETIRLNFVQFRNGIGRHGCGGMNMRLSTMFVRSGFMLVRSRVVLVGSSFEK
jgi:hypothetical protein